MAGEGSGGGGPGKSWPDGAPGPRVRPKALGGQAGHPGRSGPHGPGQRYGGWRSQPRRRSFDGTRWPSLLAASPTGEEGDGSTPRARRASSARGSRSRDALDRHKHGRGPDVRGTLAAVERSLRNITESILLRPVAEPRALARDSSGRAPTARRARGRAAPPRARRSRRGVRRRGLRAADGRAVKGRGAPLDGDGPPARPVAPPAARGRLSGPSRARGSPGAPARRRAVQLGLELDGADVEPRAARLPDTVPLDGSRRRRFCQRAHAQASACSAIRAKSMGGSVLWKLEALDGVLPPSAMAARPPT